MNGIFMVWEKVYGCKPTFDEQIGIDRIILTLDTQGKEPNMDALISLYGIDHYEAADDKTSNTDDKQAKTDDKLTAIIKHLKEHNNSRTADIAGKLRLSIIQTKHYISLLLNDGKIVSNGANKNRTYSLNKN